MATPLATAFVKIRPDTSTFQKEATDGLKKAGRGVAAEGQRSGRLFGTTFARTSAGPFKAAAGVYSRTLAGIGTGFAAVKVLDFGRDSVKAFTEAQTSQARLEDAFKRFPRITDVTIGSLRNLNTQLAQKTRFDDDAFASGQAVLAQFGLTGKQLTDLTPILADYAAKTGKDLPGAAKTLGKAFLGNTRALKELGINYKPTGDKAKDMANIQKLVNQRVGGFAEREGKTAAGQAKILGNQFGELQEGIGSKLLPVLSSLLKLLLGAVKFFQRNSDILVPLAAAVLAVAAAVKIWITVQKILNLVLAANPIGLVITAVIGLAVALVVAYKKSETFRKIVDAVFRFVWNTIKTVWNWLKHNWPLLLGILTGPIGVATVLIIKNWKKIYDGVKSLLGSIREFFQKLPGRIVGYIGTVGRLLYEKGKAIITGLWDGIKAIWKSTIDWFKGLPSKILSALGINSPPKWAIEAGRHIMGGILKGIIPGGKQLLQYAKDTVGNLAGIGAGAGGLLGRILAGGGVEARGSAVEIGQRMAASVGWTGAQWRALYDLWNNESGWNPLADNPTSTAFGIPQFLAGTARQYGVYGDTDPARQIAAGLQYISDRYGDPFHAWAAWLGRSPHWYDQGGWLPPGLSLAVNKTGKPERVLGPRESYGNTYNINITVPPNANQHEIGRRTVEAIKAYEKGSGTGWRK